MKNAFYTPEKESLLLYLKDRRATYTPVVSYDGNVLRTSVRNSGIRYKNILKGLVSNPISYRINILVKKNNPDSIRILLPTRKYVVRLQYSDSDVICSFPFKFDQVTFRKDLHLDKYVDDFDAVDAMIDKAICQQIEIDLQEIFAGLVESNPNANSKETWVLKTEERPAVKFKLGYEFE